MSDTPTTPEPAEAPADDGGAAVEVPAEWEGMTEAEDETVDVTTGDERPADEPDDDSQIVDPHEEEPPEPDEEPRRFTDPDSIIE